MRRRRDGGVHEHAVTTELHGDGRIRGGANACVHHDGDLGILDDGEDVVWIADAESGSDGRRQRHHRHAAHVFQTFGHDGVIVGVDHHLETVLDQLLGSLQSCRDIGKQGLLVAEHFELHQIVTIEKLAGELAGTNRGTRVVATGCVRQNRVLIGREEIQEVRLTWILADVGAANGNRDDAGAARLDGLAGLLEIPVLAGTHQQPRGVLHAGHDQRRVDGSNRRISLQLLDHRHGTPGLNLEAHPPPMARTISTRSPSCNRYPACRLRGTTSSLTSTANRLPVNSRWSISPRRVRASSRPRCSPLRTISMDLDYEGPDAKSIRARYQLGPLGRCLKAPPLALESKRVRV